MRVAVITGASSGIGAAFARKLAAEGMRLVLVARRAERLETLAAELRSLGAAEVDSVPADLTVEQDLARVLEHIGALDGLDLLINSAGFGIPGSLWETAWEPQSALIRLHTDALPRLCRASAPLLIRAKGRGIINVASIGALIPKPGDAVYCASKAFVVALSVALADEFAGTGVHVQALCPGFTRTEFYATPAYAGMRISVPRWLWHSADQVARSALRALAAGRVVHVPGLLNRLLVGVARTGGRRLLLGVLDQAVTRAPQ